MPANAEHHQLLIARVEAAIDRLLPGAEERPPRLHQAMRYSMQAGGKRLRPVLVIACAELGEADLDPLPAAVAIECIHTYSLIHDDLPCMDNDALRRGRPTAHVQFDEATALLAGDALLTFAFELLSHAYQDAPARLGRMIRELSSAAGSRQLIGGQMADLLGERVTAPDAETLNFIHANKTAAMIRASVLLGAQCARAPSERGLTALRAFGENLGLAFQIIDDVLDATADTAQLGKTAGKDAKADKTTFVKLHGIEGARHEAERHSQLALSALAEVPGDTAFLRMLAELMLRRKS
ncbi:polyprenyl synthetase family protein [Nibricoccus sp. IMCC34717]|uniref:polyprenyl synthetase family protein n=1 Tax=Nibricoccus sp. IMCC34717 TaxID=3034021 RepID=UPI00384C2049